MVKPTPLRPRRTYTKRQKITAVMAAEMTSLTAAAEATGIPLTTLDYWMDRPEFVALRMKTREDQAEAAKTLGLKVLGEITRRLPEFEPRDLTILYGVLTDKSQLLSGAATQRTESVTNGLNDHERTTLRDVVQRAVAEAEA